MQKILTCLGIVMQRKTTLSHVTYSMCLWWDIKEINQFYVCLIEIGNGVFPLNVSYISYTQLFLKSDVTVMCSGKFWRRMKILLIHVSY